jgi:hypothetical protein
MYLKIESPMSITSINRQLRAIYPNLRLEHIKSGSENIELNPVNQGKIFITPYTTLAQLEAILKENYGLPLRIVWRMGSNWVSTLEEPGKTMEEINKWSKIYDPSTKMNFFTLFL